MLCYPKQLLQFIIKSIWKFVTYMSADWSIKTCSQALHIVWWHLVPCKNLSSCLQFSLSFRLSPCVFVFGRLCLSFSLLMPLCICLTLLPSVSLSICHSFRQSFLVNALHSMSLFSVLPIQVMPANTTSRPSLFHPTVIHIKKNPPTPLHLLLVLPSCLLFRVCAPAQTTHTLPPLLNQQREVPGGGDPSQWQVECRSQQNSHVWLCLCLWRRPCQSVIYTSSNNIWWLQAADSYYSATEQNMVHFALKFFHQGMKSYSFGLTPLSRGSSSVSQWSVFRLEYL